MFKGPQRMSLAGTVDVSVISMFQYSWCFFVFLVKNIFLVKKNIFGQKNFLTKIFFLKNQLCWNIDLTETSTVPASDIPWGPLNIDRAA